MIVQKTDWLPSLDPSSSTPVYEQLVESLALAIVAGSLAPGDGLPSVRELAAKLRINPNTAARAIRHMEREGLSQSIRGVGSVVADGAPERAAERARQAVDRELEGVISVAVRLGLPWEELLEALQAKWKERKR